MGRILAILLYSIILASVPMWSQDIDNSFVFVDEEGEIIADGATVVRNTAEQYDEGTEVIYSGISVLNVSAPVNQLIRVHFSIKQIDNGSYQICFPITCNTSTEVGDFVTSGGTLMSDLQDIQSAWFPTADGTCIVELQIELVTKSGFPPTVSHQAWGRSMTLKFVKGEYHNIYCFNGIYYYKTGENTVSVTFNGDSYNSYHGNIIIPETIELEGNTYTVTAIANNAFKDCLDINSLSIPVTISSIAKNTFSNCSVNEVIIYGTGDWQAGELPINMETLYICEGITSIEGLNVNPFLIYSYSLLPPVCDTNTFKDYSAILHVPTTGTASYFMAPYWCNFASIMSDAIEPKTVSMIEETIQLEKGKQLHLIATVNPSNSTPNNVKWLSTNQDVALVQNGIVTAESIGECDIIAFCADKRAVCHISVIPAPVTITLDKHEANVLPNHIVTLVATCSPVSAELSVSSSDNNIAIPRIINGTIQVLGLKEGIAIITVNTADGNGIPDECEVTVYTEHGDVNSDGYVNISDVTTLIDYLLSGNPSNINLTSADCNSNGNITISDVTTLIDFLLSGTWPFDT